MLTELAQVPLTRFAFGSCNHSDEDQHYWRVIARDQPQLWIWLGDMIYGDGMTMRQRLATYYDLYRDPSYRDFRKAVPVVGTWDDHDYASNNKEGSFAYKSQSKFLAMRFLDIPESSPVAGRSGIYQSYLIGPVGQRTKVILLDLRYNMSRAEEQLLGEMQWLFLTEELQTGDFELLIIGSSLNVTAAAGRWLEGWGSFPRERLRLYNLIAATECPVLILSGDRHQAEFARFTLANGRSIYEFMSSGLTHFSGMPRTTPFRLGKTVYARNYGLVTITWTDSRPEIGMTIRSPVAGDTLGEYGFA
jgi:alkaline phosphatase D